MENILQTTKTYCQFKIFRNIICCYLSFNIKAAGLNVLDFKWCKNMLGYNFFKFKKFSIMI